MGQRVQLQTVLESILGTRNVYYQPPETVKLNYPCIIYERNQIQSIHASDNPYKRDVQYSVTLVDPNPDSGFIDKLLMLPKCSFERHYKANNLNHDVFNIYY